MNKARKKKKKKDAGDIVSEDEGPDNEATYASLPAFRQNMTQPKAKKVQPKKANSRTTQRQPARPPAQSQSLPTPQMQPQLMSSHSSSSSQLQLQTSQQRQWLLPSPPRQHHDHYWFPQNPTGFPAPAHPPQPPTGHSPWMTPHPDWHPSNFLPTPFVTHDPQYTETLQHSHPLRYSPGYHMHTGNIFQHPEDLSGGPGHNF